MGPIKKMCKKYRGHKHNYILAMYYIENYKYIGEKKAIMYSNMYLNWLELGCKYSQQLEVNKMCPEYLNGDFCVPEFFKNVINEIL